MATFYEFRAEVAKAMDLYYAGTITGEDNPGLTYIEDSNLLRFTGTDALAGGYLFTAKAQALGGWRDAQWRAITGFAPYVDDPESQPSISVEHPLALDADETTLVGDMYEIFRALTPDQWNQAILDAVKSAWPMIFEIRRVNPSAGSDLVAGWTFDEEIDQIVEVKIHDTVNFADHGEQPIPPAQWRVENTQDLLYPTLHILATLPDYIDRTMVVCYVSGRYDVPGIDQVSSYPTIDHAYLMAQSRANVYASLADATQRQAAHGNYMTQQQHFQGIADRRKAEVYAQLTGQEVKAE